MNYNQKLKDPRWQKKRLKILERDNFICQLCKDDKTELHVHHDEYSGEPWEVDDKFLTTVCKHCHSILHMIDQSKHSLSMIKIIKIRQSIGDMKVSFVFLYYKSGQGKLIQSFLINHSGKDEIEENGVFSEDVLDEFNNRFKNDR